jgi:hypothetical protein
MRKPNTKTPPPDTPERKQGRGKAKPIPAPLPGADFWLSKVDIAAALRISVRRFEQIRSEGKYPPPDRMIGNLPRWTVPLHDRFMREKLEGYPVRQE